MRRVRQSKEARPAFQPLTGRRRADNDGSLNRSTHYRPSLVRRRGNSLLRSIDREAGDADELGDLGVRSILSLHELFLDLFLAATTEEGVMKFPLSSKWEITCTTPELGDVVFCFSQFGDVWSIEPASSPFAMEPLSIDGFAPPGTDLFIGEMPPLGITDALESGTDMTGMALVLRADMTFVANAIVTGPPRLLPQGVDSAPNGDLRERDEWEIGEWFQSVTDKPHSGDDNPVTITVRQAKKISAIIDAARKNEIYRDALSDVSWFLDCVALPASGMPVELSTTAEQAWARVDVLPWIAASAWGADQTMNDLSMRATPWSSQR